jgi:1,2-dihydroxy-3-keto-5-methylthiopentene dioxygenase
MSHLTRYHQDRPEQPLGNTSDAEEIRALLAEAGVRFERWRADRPLPADADQAQIGAAYRSDIDRLMARRRLPGRRRGQPRCPDHPDKAALRQKFLNEHTHAEDEVRFFVAGRGLFTLHLGKPRCTLLCEARRPDQRSRRHPPLVRHGPRARLRRHPRVHQPRRLGRATSPATGSPRAFRPSTTTAELWCVIGL